MVRASVMPRRCPFVVVVLSLALAVLPARAAGPVDDGKPRLRVTDSRLQDVVADGVRHSPSLRALVERLAAADVVVYVECARLPPHLDGQLTFVSAAGGLRYVRVRLAWDRPLMRKIASLAHELQHAVEIAEHPAIVDRLTLAREYSRFGLVHESADGNTTSFDTVAAIDVGRRVWRELIAEAGD